MSSISQDFLIHILVGLPVLGTVYSIAVNSLINRIMFREMQLCIKCKQWNLIISLLETKPIIKL